MAALDIVLQMALGIALTAWIVRRDTRAGGPERLARSWNVASFWSAIVTFGPLCIPVHFARTRRSVGGFVVGVAWGAVVIGAVAVVSAGVQWIAE